MICLDQILKVTQASRISKRATQCLNLKRDSFDVDPPLPQDDLDDPEWVAALPAEVGELGSSEPDSDSE